MSKIITSEMFSVDIFRYLWYRRNIFQIILPRPKLYENKWMPTFFIELVVQITGFRRIFFEQYLIKYIRDSVNTFSESGIDFYLFFKENIAKFFPNKDMVIFDKIFMSLAFAVEMCFWCAEKGTSNFIYYAPTCWELYFQTEMGERFNDEGGWDEFIMYAELYRQSKIFSLHDSYRTSLIKHGFVDLKDVFKTAIDDYDIFDLVEYFKEKLQKHQGSKFCLQCLPLFTALSTVAFAEKNVKYNSILIEGYIQILLQMLSDDAMEKLTISVKNNLKYDMPELYENNILDHQNVNSLSAEIVKLHEMQEFERVFTEVSEIKKSATKTLIERLFEEDYFECDDSDCSKESDHVTCTFNTCIFCAKEVFLLPEPTPKETLREEIKLIKSEICETLKTTQDKNTSNTKMGNTKTQLKSADILEDNHIWIEVNSRDEKDALRMFFVLGVEPGRTRMLNALKNQDSKLATEDISKLKLEECVKRNRRKAKNKKKIKSEI